MGNYGIHSTEIPESHENPEWLLNRNTAAWPLETKRAY